MVVTEEPDQNVEVTGGDQVEQPAGEQEEGEAVDELAVLSQELEKAKAKEAEYLEGWQRARAELANARKRFQREQERSYANAKADVLVQLLPIADNFERALETLPDDLSGLSWIEGVMLIQRELQLLLEQAGVMPIEAAGQEFDPLLHQAVTHEPTDAIPAGHVISELQRGYMVGDRVLRPSMVRVSSGPPAEPETSGPETGDQADTEAPEDRDEA